MDNFQIADLFTLLAKLMDIHGENSFKAKSYASAAFQLEKAPQQVANMNIKQVALIKGIGDSAAKKIAEIVTTGQLEVLNDLLEKTPAGILEMLQIKGLGPKKIATIWKEMEIESIGELLYACTENRLTLYKGFGEKSQQNIKDTIEFYLRHQGSFLYQQIEPLAQQVLEQLQQIIAPSKIYLTGTVPMHADTVQSIELTTNTDLETIKNGLSQNGILCTQDDTNTIHFKLEAGAKISISSVSDAMLMQTVFEKNCSPAFATAFKANYHLEAIEDFETEVDYFTSLPLTYIPAYLRYDADILTLAEENKLPQIIQTSDIKGIIHSHSNWSDGSYTIEQMAVAAKEKGFEYLVISDHSKSAFYANGLHEDRIIAQHQQIETLNHKLAPFRIFKSIESDILNDGSLDYEDDLLASFDLVIASVHSNLKMTEEKAMMRLINAIENPYTTILGHMTGRLLLSRKGYPINHKAVIDACVANNVVIELNAHPRRLDMDWSWIRYATDKGALISIDPDAHSIDGYDDIRYGVIAAQKGLLTAQQNLSSFSLADFERFLMDRRR